MDTTKTRLQKKLLYSPEDPNSRYLCETEPAATEKKNSFLCVSVAGKFQCLMDFKNLRKLSGVWSEMLNKHFVGQTEENLIQI